MVKPPKDMQPEGGRDLSKAGRASNQSFTGVNFRNYMTRKIHLQRRQFGLVPPPPPPPPKTSSLHDTTSASHFCLSLAAVENPYKGKLSPSRKRPRPHPNNVNEEAADSGPSNLQTKTESSGGGLVGVLQSLQRRFGKAPSSSSRSRHRSHKKRRRQEESGTRKTSRTDDDEAVRYSSTSSGTSPSTASTFSSDPTKRQRSLSEKETDVNPSHDAATPSSPSAEATAAPHLFLQGVVVMVNGDTNPDADTIQRLLHAHGGDLEKYETVRITHIVAEHLSAAKAKIYQTPTTRIVRGGAAGSTSSHNQKKPWVVYPKWILDCIRAQKRLPEQEYVLKELERPLDKNQTSVLSFFHGQQAPKSTAKKSPKLYSARKSLEAGRVSIFDPAQTRTPPSAQMQCASTSNSKKLVSQSQSDFHTSPQRKRHLSEQFFLTQVFQDELDEGELSIPDGNEDNEILVIGAVDSSEKKSQDKPAVATTTPDLCFEMEDKISHSNTSFSSPEATDNRKKSDTTPSQERVRRRQSMLEAELMRPSQQAHGKKRKLPPISTFMASPCSSPTLSMSHATTPPTDHQLKAKSAPLETPLSVSSTIALDEASATLNEGSEEFGDPISCNHGPAIASSNESVVPNQPTVSSNEQTKKSDESIDTPLSCAAVGNKVGSCAGSSTLDASSNDGVDNAVSKPATFQVGSSAAISGSNDHTPIRAKGRTDDKYIDGRIRTVGTDPNFLESFFQNSRLSYIGSFKQRVTAAARSPNFKQAPKRQADLAVERSSKQRFVFHIDMDCFFASVVLRKYPQYRNKPVAISHHGRKESGEQAEIHEGSTSECATCNYEARKYGIKKGMFLGRAKALCPDLIVLQYDFEGYQEVSAKVSEILYDVTSEHNGAIEEVSCDESYLELYLPREPKRGQSCHEFVAQIAESLRTDIWNSTECTATVGVAENKFLAKLATDKVKPNGMMVASDYRELLESLRLRDIHGIGYRLDVKLREQGLDFVKDVWDRGEGGRTLLQKVLGAQLGMKIWNFCYGRDDRPVEEAERKTIGAECNYGVRFNGPYGVDHMIRGLAAEVQRRMESVGVRGSKLTLKVKQRKPNASQPPKFLGHGSCFNLSKSVDTGGASQDAELFARLGLEMFSKLNVTVEEVRGMGLVVSKLSGSAEAPSVHQGIRKFFQGEPRSTKPASSEAGHIIESEEIREKEAKPDIVDIDNCSVQSGSDYSATSTIEILEVKRRKTEEFDISLPAFSQIHMSQVEALPSPMRRQVLVKMEASGSSESDRFPPVPIHSISSSDHQLTVQSCSVSSMKQTSVVGMLRLEAIKSGTARIPGYGDEKISLTQFTSLPLEIQLELANGMQISKATSGKPLKYKSGKMKPSAPPKSPPKRSTCSAEAVQTMVESFESADSNQFHMDNIAPFRTFMDENSPPCDSAVRRATDFVLQFVEADHLTAVAMLMRVVFRRKDEWGSKTYDRIRLFVDQRMQELTGSVLDIE